MVVLVHPYIKNIFDFQKKRQGEKVNKDRRKYIKQIIAELSRMKENLESVKNSEQESFDNIPENLQGSEIAEGIESNLNELDETVDLADEIISRLEGLL